MTVEDLMGEIVDLLAADPGKQVDPRAWSQLLIYGPTKEPMKVALGVLCAARQRAYADGWHHNFLKDFDIAIYGLRGALGIAEDDTTRLKRP